MKFAIASMAAVLAAAYEGLASEHLMDDSGYMVIGGPSGYYVDEYDQGYSYLGPYGQKPWY